MEQWPGPSRDEDEDDAEAWKAERPDDWEEEGEEWRGPDWYPGKDRKPEKPEERMWRDRLDTEDEDGV